jgi:hypothetical protein
MTSQPDKLFREKLENLSTPAPVVAWSRIEAGLDKPVRSFWWLKVAASITLVSVAAFLLWPSATIQQTEIASLPTPSKSLSSPIASKSESSVTPNQTVTIESNKLETNHAKKEISKVENLRTEELLAEVIAVETEVISTENSVTETIVQVEPIVESSQTIIYSEEEVNAKFLKKELVAEATTEEKKTSGIQKLIGVAYNLASAEPGLGNIRQRKDEVLALNFRDKKQGQN